MTPYYLTKARTPATREILQYIKYYDVKCIFRYKMAKFPGAPTAGGGSGIVSVNLQHIANRLGQHLYPERPISDFVSGINGGICFCRFL
jgi:hypothetical protein